MLTFDGITAALTETCRARADVDGLVLLGSASAEHRRDEWSDHDFFVILGPGSDADLRDSTAWLPDHDHIVLHAREGGIGFTAMYENGHVLEYAVATTEELGPIPANDYTVAVDRGPVAAYMKDAYDRGERAAASDPANEVRLALVKILIGVGRGRRGELLNAGAMIRTYALGHFLRAFRERHPVTGSVRDSIDPVRRFEQDYPALGAEIDRVLAAPVEPAARELFHLIRRSLEPAWDAFPSRAADSMAERLGWGLGSAAG